MQFESWDNEIVCFKVLDSNAHVKLGMQARIQVNQYGMKISNGKSATKG
jgi:hypothetical protein